MIEAINFTFAAVVLPTIAALTGQLSGLRIDQVRQKQALQEAMQRLDTMAHRDPLTGLPNRRHAHEWVASLRSGARRKVDTLSLALIDLDHFKRINDAHGHAVGDRALRIFSHETARLLRDADLVSRWGGEEFLVRMPDTSTGDACQALERLRNRLAEPAVWVECPLAQVTFSAGLTALHHTSSLEQAIQSSTRPSSGGETARLSRMTPETSVLSTATAQPMRAKTPAPCAVRSANGGAAGKDMPH